MSGVCGCGGEGASTQSGRESAYEMLRVEEALRVVLAEAEPLPTEVIPSAQSLGRVLAAPATSTEPLPPFRASIMDGYAVVSSDGTGEFPVIRRIAAGDSPVASISAGQAAYITTGSPVPHGADAVVKVEDTEGIFEEASCSQEVRVKILQAVRPGQNIRDIGSDIARGEELVRAGERITPAELGLLATAGIEHVTVYRSPIVGVLSTGSELVEPFAPVSPGMIRDSNRPMLLGLLSGWNVNTEDFGIGKDTKIELEKRLVDVLKECDVLVTSGGVSMGEHDLIKPILEKMGHVHFGRLYMKPGKPTTFATVSVNGRKKLVFALPGNPVSSFTTCHLLVHPALKRLQGLPLDKCKHVQVFASVSHGIKLDPERPEFHRANVTWDLKSQAFIATSTGLQISSRLSSCRKANALLSLPTGTEIRPGEAVVTFLLDGSFENVVGPTSSSEVTHSLQPVATQSANPPASTKTFRAGILTVSDRVSMGVSEDLSGPAMATVLANTPNVAINVVISAAVPDEIDQIQSVVKEWTDNDIVDIILTSGGTGFSPRDVTPEAIKGILDKDIPGFVIAMLESSLKITPKAILSRPVAGIRAKTLILTLPGKPKAVMENFTAVQEILQHALHLVRDIPHGHHRANRQI